MLKLLAMTCILTAGTCACGGGGPASVAPLAGTAALVGTHAAAQERLVTLGDSITANALGYAPLLASALGATLTNLAINGQFSGAVIYGAIHQGGVLADEVANIPLDTTLVTLYIGTNDMWLFGVSDYPGYLDVATTLARYDANIRSIIAGIRQRVPAARIVVASVPNSANRSGNAGLPQAIHDAVTAVADGMRASLLATGLPIVDLEHEPAMYDDANFGSNVDPHPNAAGCAIVAADFAKVIQGH